MQPIGPGDVHQALERAQALVAAGEPRGALRVVLEILSAVGLERQAGTTVARVQEALAAGSASAAAADELAGLLSLVSLQQGAQGGTQQQLGQLPQAQAGQQWQQQAGPAAMDMGGGSGPGPPDSPSAAPEPEQARVQQLAAAAEGASYVCQRCGGVVALARRDVHEQLWCPATQGS